MARGGNEEPLPKPMCEHSPCHSPCPQVLLEHVGLFHPFQTRFSGYAEMGGHEAERSDLQSLHTAGSSSQGGLAAVTTILHGMGVTAALDAPLLIQFGSSSNK